MFSGDDLSFKHFRSESDAVTEAKRIVRQGLSDKAVIYGVEAEEPRQAIEMARSGKRRYIQTIDDPHTPEEKHAAMVRERERKRKNDEINYWDKLQSRLKTRSFLGKNSLKK